MHEPIFGTIIKPLKIIAKEHTIEGEYFRQLNKLTAGFTLPRDACNTFKTTFSLMSEFREKLQFHIQLMNHVLFPKAIRMEKELL